MKKTWVSMAKLASDLGISRQTVQNWTKRNQIEFKYDPNLMMKVVNPNSVKVKTVEKDDDGKLKVKKNNIQNLRNRNKPLHLRNKQ